MMPFLLPYLLLCDTQMHTRTLFSFIILIWEAYTSKVGLYQMYIYVFLSLKGGTKHHLRSLGELPLEVHQHWVFQGSSLRFLRLHGVAEGIFHRRLLEKLICPRKLDAKRTFKTVKIIFSRKRDVFLSPGGGGLETSVSSLPRRVGMVSWEVVIKTQRAEC